MATFISDGKKLLDVEYDDIVEINDIVDGMRVISKDVRDGEYAVFMLELNGNICCYVFDEVFIIARVNGFETLLDAITAWKRDEI
ncbi:MAG: hypothetical protein A2513_02930 [Sulfurimonas sp. RIFOXYD12_FULL_33_39]|uniref:hypothetical protein n=1 Tax=unclassified Sulfurimonas TaxID=2623549 RepID=UPI0008AE24EB|nr:MULTISPECIES: hypothetical protein [unclassified Sulfurimonas]OHE01650.1 MAG: hypothetical protein A3G74_00535 [Sulfurimonas sp. RIFCSPLOWO2_12_FULL_34_6]OHE08949.1 MAG: hypothetical protein A2513_02930 [Sulfurimonas sp. RIFOXYD12_FULL_33_39]OHE14259.1 MAG: hypothetical protein A2530_06230 [Sulfurimonas sp. RIFOXYD2_FULL_34_21]DAB28888.1 MAG TPA: hypothetical protein CFH78_00165 [Sulfurimonas sp. UBA10385]